MLLSGVVVYEMYAEFRRHFDKDLDEALVVIELSTLGGNPEAASMIGEDIRFHSKLSPDRRFISRQGGHLFRRTTFMSFFARQNRYVTRGSRLIHERKLSKTLTIDGLLTTCARQRAATLNESSARSRTRTRVSRILPVRRSACRCAAKGADQLVYRSRGSDNWA